MPEPTFQKWPETPRLFREVTITEKIDGTNSAVIVSEDGSEVWAQSRKRLITPDNDNFGFAAWVWENAGALTDALGPGYHYGEWWGSGIQRGYDMPQGQRVFSLFNTKRWTTFDGLSAVQSVPNMDVVPVMYKGTFSEWEVEHELEKLRKFGSFASPGFPNPEGIVIYHRDANQCFKVTLEDDHMSKAEAVMNKLAHVA